MPPPSKTALRKSPQHQESEHDDQTEDEHDQDRTNLAEINHRDANQGQAKAAQSLPAGNRPQRPAQPEQGGHRPARGGPSRGVRQTAGPHDRPPVRRLDRQHALGPLGTHDVHDRRVENVRPVKLPDPHQRRRRCIPTKATSIASVDEDPTCLPPPQKAGAMIARFKAICGSLTVANSNLDAGSTDSARRPPPPTRGWRETDDRALDDRSDRRPPTPSAKSRTRQPASRSGSGSCPARTGCRQGRLGHDHPLQPPPARHPGCRQSRPRGEPRPRSSVLRQWGVATRMRSSNL